jgi:hypothetical protein
LQLAAFFFQNPESGILALEALFLLNTRHNTSSLSFLSESTNYPINKLLLRSSRQSDTFLLQRGSSSLPSAANDCILTVIVEFMSLSRGMHRS